MHALLRLANLKRRMDARARWLTGIVPEQWQRLMRSMSPLRYTWQAASAESPEEPPVRAGTPYFLGQSPERFVPVRRRPVWKRVLRMPGVFMQHYFRLRELNRPRWQSAAAAARMTLELLR